MYHFNPRLREGGDEDDFDVKSVVSPISIHASAREATRKIPKEIVDKIFQSTPPRGRRHGKHPEIPAVDYFNPRLREGGDPLTPLIT